MKYYINNRGVIVETIQWDGSDKAAEEIKKRFNLNGEPAKYKERQAHGETVYYCYEMINDNGTYAFNMRNGDYVFIEPLSGRVKNCLPLAFEQIFKLVTDEGKLKKVKELLKQLTEGLHEKEGND